MTRSMASGMLMGKLRSLVPSTSQCTVAINQFKRDRSANRMRFDDAELDELARGAHFFPTLRIALPDDRWTQPPSEDDRGSSPRHDDDELSAAARASNLRGDEATQPSPGGASSRGGASSERDSEPDPGPSSQHSLGSFSAEGSGGAGLGGPLRCFATARKSACHASNTYQTCHVCHVCKAIRRFRSSTNRCARNLVRETM